VKESEASKRLSVELEGLEKDVLEQVRRLSQSRRTSARSFERVLRELGAGQLGSWLTLAQAGQESAAQARDMRRLATQFGRAVVQESARASRRTNWFGGGRTPAERVVGDFSSGAYLGGLAGGGGEHASRYGGLGGVLGYAVGGPVGGFVGSVLGGLFGHRQDRTAQRRQQEARTWLNSPEEFEIQAYLYSLRRPIVPRSAASAGGGTVKVVVQRGAVQISGQDAESGSRAGNALIGELGRAVELAQAASATQGY
jgi:hypothetical protein